VTPTGETPVPQRAALGITVRDAERSEYVEVPAAEHPDARGDGVQRRGRWEDRALHGKMAQHPRRTGPVERNGQRDDWGVEAVSFQPSAISSMVGRAVGMWSVVRI